MSFSRIAGLRNLLSGPSAGNSRSFTSTSSLLAESKRKRAARLKKQANQARKIRAAQEERQTAPDLILGYNPSTDAGVKLWQDSKLANILLSPRQVWGTTVEAARQSGSSAPSLDDGLELQDQCTIPEPQAWNFGLTNEEASFLFEGLPRFNAAQSTSTDTNQLEQGVQNEQDKVDQLKRILDLKNANAQGIWVENSRRIVKEFGRTGAHDTASPEVQGQSRLFVHSRLASPDHARGFNKVPF